MEKEQNSLSLTHISQIKYYSETQIFEIETLMDLHVLKPSESENYVFSSWIMRVCIISTSQKQNVAENANFVFFLYVMHRYLMKLFIKIEQKVCAKKYTLKMEDWK